MNEVFNNDSTPYNNIISKDKYHNAIKKTLLNIKQFIEQEFDIKIDNYNDTWMLGKTLSALLFPQYLKNSNDIEKLRGWHLIKFFKDRF